MSHFEEAPPLPRHPTDLSVPDAMAGSDVRDIPTVESLSEDSSVNPSEPSPAPPSQIPPPPPKFPSLTDVALPSALAASAGATSSAPVVPAAQPTDSDLQHHSSTVQAAFYDNIEAAILRDAVEPGTGAKKAVEIGKELWTETDQEKLDRLLAEGQDVYVPPDVGVADLPVARASGYAYVPVPPPPSSGVDASPDERSMADRIAVWNQVVPKEDSDHRSISPLAVVAPVAVPLHPTQTDQTTDPVADAETEVVTPAEADSTSAAAGATADSEILAKQDKATVVTPPVRGNTRADLSRTIFNGSFYTVPVVNRKKMPTEKTSISDTPAEDTENPQSQDVLLRTEASARVDVKEDFGLRGGHDAIVHDAAFMHGQKTLVTCGSDGKVCIWDMEVRAVEKEFVPYDGEPVTMVYPVPDDDETTQTLMTLSESRLMRIWAVESTCAVMLRDMQIKDSDNDLFMTVQPISKELKARAAAAAAAALVETSYDDPRPVETGTADQLEAGQTSGVAEPTTPVGASTAVVSSKGSPETSQRPKQSSRASEREEDKERKSFFTKVLSIGRSSQRKAVAS